MDKKVSAQYISELAELVGLALAEGELAELALHLDRQLGDFSVLSTVNIDGVQPTFDAVFGGDKYKLERLGE